MFRRVNPAERFVISCLLVILLIYLVKRLDNSSKKNNIIQIREDIIDFEGFDNSKREHGSQENELIVPNIVHLLYFQSTEIKFYQVINIYSIYLNQNPDLIYIHCDNCSFHGQYWQEIQSVKGLREIIILNQIKFHDTIFGKKYGWVNHHRSDVWRLLVLMNYGGMYFDNDVYVVNSLDKYRKYEMTVSWDQYELAVGVQILIAHRNARLLKAHFDGYRFVLNLNKYLFYFLRV
jgi:hypothetical protein